MTTHLIDPTNPQCDVESLHRSYWEPEDAVRLAETITESLHQDLDGWSDEEKQVIKAYIEDIGRAMYHATI